MATSGSGSQLDQTDETHNRRFRDRTFETFIVAVVIVVVDIVFVTFKWSCVPLSDFTNVLLVTSSEFLGVGSVVSNELGRLELNR